MLRKLVAGLLVFSGAALDRGMSAPTLIAFEAVTLDENSVARSLAGNFSAINDEETNGHEFDLVVGIGDTHNPLFFTDGNKLKIRNPIDHEQVGGQLEIRVRATDSSGDLIEQSFTVILVDDRTEDADRDGLIESEEEDVHGTSDLEYDTDHDGIGDAAEILDGTSPLDSTAYSDYPLVSWGANDAGSLAAPYDRTYGNLSAGGAHAAAIRFDGSVTTWGGNGALGQMTVPEIPGPVAEVSAGGEFWRVDTAHTLALLMDGSVVAWGNNESGQATVPPGLTGVVEVSAGRAHSLALRSDGTVVAWGNNHQDQCSVPSDLGNVVAVAAGGHFSLALKENGTVSGWGEIFDGVNWVPMEVPKGLRDVVAISAGWFHALALRADGSVVAWGSNSHGQVSVPPEAVDLVALEAGGFHSLGLNAAGGVIAWGDNQQGQAAVPPAGQLNVATISAGGFYSLALRQSGDFPEFLSSRQIVTVPGEQVVHAVSVSNAVVTGFESIGLPDGLSLDPETGVISGSVDSPIRALARLWATTDKGRIGQTLWISSIEGTAPSAIALNPSSVVENSPGEMEIGRFTAEDPDLDDPLVFELVDGAGAQWNGQFRIENGMLRTAPEFDLDFEAIDLPLTVRVRATDSFLNEHDAIVVLDFLDDRTEDADGDGISEADEEDIHLTSDISSDSDGDGFSDSLEIFHGSLPNDSASRPGGSVLVSWAASHGNPISVPPDLGDVVAVSSGATHHLVLRSDGSVMGWGGNDNGQAMPPEGPAAFASIAAGGFHNLGLRQDGTVEGWGLNTEGQADTPTDLVDVVQVAAGKFHSVALKRDGSVVAWGRNDEQQCDVPTDLGTVVAVAAGDAFTVALLNDGRLTSWGTSAAGTGGIASAGGEVVVDVAAGGSHGLALRADGTVFGWGENGHGQIVPPPGLNEVISISAGHHHSAALLKNGTVVVWGDSTQQPPFDARQVVRLSSGGGQLLALRREVALPGVIAEPPLEASQAMTVVHQIEASGGNPLSFAVIGLQEDLELNPLTGVISGTIANGQLRTVRVMIETHTGPAAKVVPVNTRDGVVPDELALDSIPVVENAAASTYVGTFTVVDRDPLDAHTFELVQGAGSDQNSHFAIAGNQLVAGPAGSLDFELLGPTLYIRVRASDLAGKTIDRRFTLNLINDWSEDDDLDGLNESEELYQDWAAGRNLVGEQAQPHWKDPGGVPNLIRYAIPVDAGDVETIASAPLIYEAESAQLSGALIQTKYPGFTGTGYGDFVNSTNDFIQWNIVAPVTQSYEVGFRYALGAGSNGDRPLEVSVNGEVVTPSQSFPETGPTWEDWSTLWVDLPLVAGPNRIKLRAIGFSGANFDHLELRMLDLFGELTGKQGVPAVNFKYMDDGDLIQILYIRRRAAGLMFSPMQGIEPDTTAMQAFGGEPTIIEIDSNWELVATESLLPSSPRRFIRLGVDFP